MAETDDHDSKTEEPTEKRISDAVEKGNVPFAREAALFGSIAAIFAACMLLAGWAAAKITVALQSILGNSGSLRLEDREAAATAVTALLTVIAAAVLPIMAVIAGGTIIASLLQNPPSSATDRIAPKISRIALGAGWGRIFGKAGLVEFSKALIKFTIVVALTWFTLKSQFAEFAATLQADPILLPGELLRLAAHFIGILAVFSLLLAIADLAWSRLKWRRDLRMTSHDVKQEMKQAEGDPHIKARIRSIARQRSSRRMLEKLPQASMVIANPTHYAIALRYSREEGGAPVVVAKGVDFMALKIRELAAEHAVPIVENKPLARALYDTVEIDTQIPPEFYRAIAEIIHFLHSRRRLPRR